MTSMLSAFIRSSIVISFGAAALLWSGDLSHKQSLISSAEARIGRPLTPMSYAGVARRTTRRAVAAGAVVGVGAAAVYAAPVVVAPASVCSQAVDAYGRIVTVCR
jgi:hypothetical protein